VRRNTGQPHKGRSARWCWITEPYRYQQFCSDIAGQDVRAHHDRRATAIAAVRAMLSTALDGNARLPGAATICSRYTRFRADLPRICRQLHVKVAELQFMELRSFVMEWLAEHPLPSEKRSV
jgi:hypothetical protein